MHSINADREAALEAACRLSENSSGQLVKASQGREPPHLLQIYDGKLKILAGKHRDSRKQQNKRCIYFFFLILSKTLLFYSSGKISR